MIDIKDPSAISDLRKPRRIMKYVLVWCASGSAIMVVDENEFELTTNSVITITSGQIHYVPKRMS